MGGGEKGRHEKNDKICSLSETTTDVRCHAVVIDWPNIACLFWGIGLCPFTYSVKLHLRNNFTDMLS